MQRPDPKIQQRVREYENPTFGYRRGEDGGVEKDIFDGEVPEGWVDSPAKVDGAMADGWDNSVDLERDAVVVEAPADSALSKPYEDHTFNVLRAEFKRRTGKGPNPGTNKLELIQMLKDLDAPPEPDADE